MLLWVFTIALTPFSAFHDHNHNEPRCVSNQKTCTHKLHISNHSDSCLICKAHFEKNYLSTQQYFETYQVNVSAMRYYATVNGSYAELISLSLRGPPLV